MASDDTKWLEMAQSGFLTPVRVPFRHLGKGAIALIFPFSLRVRAAPNSVAATLDGSGSRAIMWG